MAILGIEDFKSKLRGGGARPNLFKATVNFPDSVFTSLITWALPQVPLCLSMTILKTYNFRGCFPTNVSEIEVNYETNDAIEEFTVEFQVQYWESATTS